ncbi:MAG: hypothetical protein HY680_02020 [Chloroflexi bacterium]|nr:hypothetical protein [Chloroflexota bacterium]
MVSRRQRARSAGTAAPEGAFPIEVRGVEATYALQEAPHRSVTSKTQNEIAKLETRVAALEREVETLKGAEREVLQLRSITQEQAKKEIRKLFARGNVYYISEVAERLSLPDEQVVSVIQELEKEGAIQQHERL